MAKSKDDNLEDPNAVKRPNPGETAVVEGSKLNFIQLAIDVADSSSGKPKRDKKARATGSEFGGRNANAKPAEARSSRVPDSVHERFIQIGDNFFFPGGAEAFSREQNRLTTRSENAIVIQSMVAIARAEAKAAL